MISYFDGTCVFDCPIRCCEWFHTSGPFQIYSTISHTLRAASLHSALRAKVNIKVRFLYWHGMDIISHIRLPSCGRSKRPERCFMAKSACTNSEVHVRLVIRAIRLVATLPSVLAHHGKCHGHDDCCRT